MSGRHLTTAGVTLLLLLCSSSGRDAVTTLQVLGLPNVQDPTVM